MKYTEFKVGEKELKLRLGAVASTNVEKKLGKSLLDIFMKAGEGQLPKVEDVIIILHGSLQQLNANYNMEKVYELYDEYVELGGSYIDLIAVLTEVLKTSGFFKQAEKISPQMIEDAENGLKNITAPVLMNM